MEYAPAEILRQGVHEMALTRADEPTWRAIFRGLKATGDRYDSWAEIEADAIVIGTAPACAAVVRPRVADGSAESRNWGGKI